MALSVKICERENVRPFSPTPQSLRNYKLSVLDQVASTFYMPLVFFYESHPHDDGDYVKLKDSLSKTLSVLYPLAGRLRDGITVECNDEGAEFVVANVTNYDLDEILKHPRQDILLQLFPRDPYPTTFDVAQPMLAVQMNRFRCGGIAMALCYWHGIADGAGLAGFLQTWSAFNRGENTISTNHESFIVDATAFFPPLNFNMSEKSILASNTRGRNYYAKRFVFRAEEIERLRDEYSQPDQGRRWSRVETLSALVWAAVIRATLKANPNLKKHLLTSIVDLRKRVNPPFPSTCLGNINQVIAAWWEADDNAGIQAESLIGRVRESIRRVNDDYVKKLHANGGYLKAMTTVAKQLSNSNKDSDTLGISSWFTFQCLQVDFGWGKPKWVGVGNVLNNYALLLDSIDGGVEVWIGLAPQVMCNLESDYEFLAKVSLSQVLWEPSRLSARL